MPTSTRTCRVVTGTTTASTSVSSSVPTPLPLHAIIHLPWVFAWGVSCGVVWWCHSVVSSASATTPTPTPPPTQDVHPSLTNPVAGWGVLENYEVVRKIGSSLPPSRTQSHPSLTRLTMQAAANTPRCSRVSTSSTTRNASSRCSSPLRRRR